MYNIWIVFTFVAIWHDISLNLLAWSWIICLFILPEMIANKLFSENKVRLFTGLSLLSITNTMTRKFHDMTGYRHICGLGAVFNIFTMMLGNLVGFAVGMDGVRAILEKLFDSHGLSFALPDKSIFLTDSFQQVWCSCCLLCSRSLRLLSSCLK
jgi:D-alanyl-lipoteichoic acid acyltransferase DltB (MBOAT superfamily)